MATKTKKKAPPKKKTTTKKTAMTRKNTIEKAAKITHVAMVLDESGSMVPPLAALSRTVSACVLNSSIAASRIDSTTAGLFKFGTSTVRVFWLNIRDHLGVVHSTVAAWTTLCGQKLSADGKPLHGVKTSKLPVTCPYCRRKGKA